MRTGLLLLSLFIVSAVSAATRDETAPSTQAVDIFRSDFGEAADGNFDLWPDGWTRMRGPGYPKYVRINIAEEGPAPGQRSLKIKLDGGGALVSTPPATIGPRFSYVAEALVRTSGLKHDLVSVTLVFLDEQKQVLEEIESTPLRGTNTWTPVRIGPYAPSSEKTRYASLVFHVRPGEFEDLRGEAALANIRVSRLPRMTLKAGGLKHLYFVGEPVEVTTEVCGMAAHDDKVLFELVDPYGKVLAKQEQPLAAEPLAPIAGDTKASLIATATWKPPITGQGFYRVNVSMVGDDGLLLNRTISLATIQPQPPPTGREFGWSLPEGEQPLGFVPLTTLLSHAGIKWVKFPAWYSEDDHERADRLAWFAERLSLSGIEMVGLLDQPPASQAKAFGASERLPIALIFADRDIWQPAIDPVMMRLSLKVHWWQLGGDDDVSYVGFPDLAAKLKEIKQSFDRYGQEMHLGVPWQPDKPLGPALPLEFLSYTDDGHLSTEKIAAQFGEKSRSPQHQWLALRPLPRQETT